MTKQEQFFYDNASYSHDPKTQTEEEGHVESAIAYARAETWLGQSGHTFETHHDGDADGSFIDDREERQAFLERAWYAVILDHLWYHAPLDARPHLVHVRQYTVSNVNFESSRAMLWTKETGAFSVKLIQHFDRFRKEETPLR